MKLVVLPFLASLLAFSFPEMAEWPGDRIREMLFISDNADNLADNVLLHRKIIVDETFIVDQNKRRRVFVHNYSPEVLMYLRLNPRIGTP